MWYELYKDVDKLLEVTVWGEGEREEGKEGRRGGGREVEGGTQVIFK